MKKIKCVLAVLFIYLTSLNFCYSGAASVLAPLTLSIISRAAANGGITIFGIAIIKANEPSDPVGDCVVPQNVYEKYPGDYCNNQEIPEEVIDYPHDYTSNITALDKYNIPTHYVHLVRYPYEVWHLSDDFIELEKYANDQYKSIRKKYLEYYSEIVFLETKDKIDETKDYNRDIEEWLIKNIKEGYKRLLDVLVQADSSFKSLIIDTQYTYVFFCGVGCGKSGERFLTKEWHDDFIDLPLQDDFFDQNSVSINHYLMLIMEYLSENYPDTVQKVDVIEKNGNKHLSVSPGILGLKTNQYYDYDTIALFDAIKTQLPNSDVRSIACPIRINLINGVNYDIFLPEFIPSGIYNVTKPYNYSETCSVTSNYISTSVPQTMINNQINLLTLNSNYVAPKKNNLNNEDDNNYEWVMIPILGVGLVSIGDLGRYYFFNDGPPPPDNDPDHEIDRFFVPPYLNRPNIDDEIYYSSGSDTSCEIDPFVPHCFNVLDIDDESYYSYGSDIGCEIYYF